MTYLGIDIGTSGVKALLIDRAGKPLGEATAKAVEPVRPHPGWSEQNPADWWTRDARGHRHARQVASRRSWRRCAASAFPATCTARRCSTRTTRCCARASCGTTAARPPNAPRWKPRCPRLRDIAGNIAMPGFTAPKIAWVRKHEPEIFAQDRQGAAAQGLCAAAADRRARRGHVGRRRHAVARRRQARLVGRAAGRHRPQPRAHAAPGRRLAPSRAS